MSRNLTRLSAEPAAFPDADHALDEPNGLLAIGGDLSPERLLAAYRAGIFPWYNPGEPILWWSPDPRCVLHPGRLHVSRSLRRVLGSQRFTWTFDRCFDAVVRECAAPRRGSEGTWITEEMAIAYGRLHRMGHAHSIEIWREEALVGGVYGLTIGAVFCGESMFSRASDASKVALVVLAERLHAAGFLLIDCQVPNLHLERMGAELMPRRRFLDLITGWRDASVADPWAH